jgi:outer membrane protein assembly factor BamB
MNKLLHFVAMAMISGGIACAETGPDIVEESGIKGGLVVHLGCGDGSETLKLKVSGAWLVRGLDRNPGNIQIARKKISDAGLYGPVSVDSWNGTSLPFIDNTVNLLIAENRADIDMEECMRVLCPRGKLLLRQDGKWETKTKPLPGNTDEWSHALYRAHGNAVSRDQVAGPPQGLQWTAGPKWTRHHEAGSSFQAMVSANGRVFYLLDDGPRVSLFLPSDWQLAARDAYNGKILWKRPLKRWVTQFYNYKSGPTQMTRRLVAVGDKVFVAANLDEGVTVVDAATGKTIRELEHTAAAEEILYHDGVLYLVTTDEPFLYQGGHRFSGENAWSGQKKWVRAVDPETGEELWKFETPVAPLSFAVNEYGVFLHDGTVIVRLDGNTGKMIWKSDPVPLDSVIPTSNTPTLALYKDVVLFVGGKDDNHRGGGWYAMRNLRTFTSLSAETGKILWTCRYPPSGFEAPKDILVLDGLVWMGAHGYFYRTGCSYRKNRTGIQTPVGHLLVPSTMLSLQGDGQIHHAGAHRYGIHQSPDRVGIVQSLGSRGLPVRDHAGKRPDLLSATSVRVLHGVATAWFQRVVSDGGR